MSPSSAKIPARPRPHTHTRSHTHTPTIHPVHARARAHAHAHAESTGKLDLNLTRVVSVLNPDCLLLSTAGWVAVVQTFPRPACII